MPADIPSGRIEQTRIARVSESHTERLSKHRLQVGDIVYGRRGDIGRQALVRPENEGWLCGTGCLRIRLGKSEVDAEYLHRYLSTSNVVGWIQGQAIGATMPNLNTGILNRVPVSYPPLIQQKKIAAILTAYDDLIENNRQRITLLENMAEEIYREWFVRLRFPGHESTPIDKGVPKGWAFKRLPECIEVKPKEPGDATSPRPFVGMDRLSTSSAFFSASENRTGASGSKFRNGDVLLPRITPCLENGKRGLVTSLKADTVAVGSTEFIVLRGKTLPCYYVYFLSISDSFRKHAEISMVGASGRQRVAEAALNWVLIKEPPSDLLQQFTNMVAPMFEQASNLLVQTEALTRTRDLLLNRLISGKLRVDDLDIQFPPSMQETEA